MKNRYPLRISEETFRDKNADFEVTVRTLDKDFDLHWHNFYELEFLLEGRCEHTLNEERRTIEKGDLILLSPVDLHRFRLTSGPIRLINIHFNENYITDEAAALLTVMSTGVFSSNPEIEEEVKRLTKLAQEKNVHKAAFLRNSIERILLLLSRNVAAPAPQSSGIAAALLYLENHFRENITLNDVAAAAHYSPTYFCQKFRETMGLPLRNYLSERRLKWAMSILKNTDLPISEVGYEAGFRSHAHFTRSFKHQFGISPSEARQNA